MMEYFLTHGELTEIFMTQCGIPESNVPTSTDEIVRDLLIENRQRCLIVSHPDTLQRFHNRKNKNLWTSLLKSFPQRIIDIHEINVCQLTDLSQDDLAEVPRIIKNHNANIRRKNTLAAKKAREALMTPVQHQQAIVTKRRKQQQKENESQICASVILSLSANQASQVASNRQIQDNHSDSESGSSNKHN